MSAPTVGLPGWPVLDKVCLPVFDEYNFLADDAQGAALTLETIVYCSRAAGTVDDAEVSRLIEFSQRRNAVRGITGVLAFSSGVFFQWIEEPPVEGQNLIANLHNDTRHCDIISLDRSIEQRERLYPPRKMERIDTNDIRAVLEDALEIAEGCANIAAL